LTGAGLLKMLIRDLQVILSCHSQAVANPLAHDVHWTLSANSVSRVARDFWKSFGQGSRSALRMIRLNCVRRLALLFRKAA
jgi:hypothetical protein